MKKQIFAGFAALAVMVTAFSGCNGGGQVSVSAGGSSNAQSIVIPDATAASSDAATNAPEPTAQKPEYKAEDYVRTEKDCEIKYSGAFLITGEEVGGSETAMCRQPQLTIDSADAKAVNSEIIEKTDAVFYEIGKSDRPWCRTDYVCYINGSILSLVNEMRSVDTPNSSFLVYNFNVETGERLSNDEIFAAAGITSDEAYEAVKADMTPRFDDAKDKTPDPSFVEKQRERTVASDNLEQTGFFFDGSGNLCACYRYYWIAGAESYGEIVVLESKYINVN